MSASAYILIKHLRHFEFISDCTFLNWFYVSHASVPLRGSEKLCYINIKYILSLYTYTPT